MAEKRGRGRWFTGGTKACEPGTAKGATMPSHPAGAAERQTAWQRERRQQRVAIGCMALGAIFLLTHWFRHLGAYTLPMDPAVQDLTIGYATGALLIIVGLYRLP